MGDFNEVTDNEEVRLRALEDALLLLPTELQGIHLSVKSLEDHLEMINGSLGSFDKRIGDIEDKHEYEDKREKEE